VLDAKGQLRALLAVEREGSPVLSFFAEGGQSLWKAP
jgi:hypothetical protein